VKLSTIVDVAENDMGVLRPFSLMRGDRLSTDIAEEDLATLRDIELEWAHAVGIDASRLVEILASTQTCSPTVTGIEPNTETVMDCAVDEDAPVTPA